MKRHLARAFFLSHAIHDSRKEGVPEKCESKKGNESRRSGGESESVKMVDGESESKEEIKIHERFERRRIKIHGGIIAGPSKTKARDSS